MQNDMSTAVIWSKSKQDVEFQYGGRLGEFHGMSSQSHVSYSRVLPLGEFTVISPEPHATLQGVIIPSATLKIVFAIFLVFFNAVWALTSGGFRIVSDTLVNGIADSVAAFRYSPCRRSNWEIFCFKYKRYYINKLLPARLWC